MICPKRTAPVSMSTDYDSILDLTAIEQSQYRRKGIWSRQKVEQWRVPWSTIVFMLETRMPRNDEDLFCIV